nr:hypothetical protein [Tanacetum cinerariifolium]
MITDMDFPKLIANKGCEAHVNRDNTPNKRDFNNCEISPVHAITPVLPTKEPEYSLSMGYEHLSTIPETKSGKVKKSSAKNLLPIPSEYEVTSDDESKCDVPVKDESSSVFTTFSNPLFNDNDDFTSSNDESLSDEDVPIEEFKVYSNPLFDDEEIHSDKLDTHCFNGSMCGMSECDGWESVQYGREQGGWLGKMYSEGKKGG